MPRLSWILGLLGAGVFASSCAPVGESWMSAVAKNQMMLVRSEPPSFGFERLTTQSNTFPDIAVFISRQGLPDFLAETGNQDRRYLILYYLKKREAFACRTGSGKSRAVEFAGPYPITDKEYRLLDGFRRDPSKRPEGF
jgi:hypothetical protein